MRIPSGKIDQLIYFVALDSSDRITRKTGLSSFTVYRSRNGGTATVYTTPTVAELSSSNMPGVYSLTVDEDTTIASGSDSEEYCVHIIATGMAPVTRTIEIYRAIDDVVLDRANGVESSLTVRGAVRLMLAALAGKVSGAGSGTETFRNVGDSKDRIVATVDSSGNRSAITTDAS